MTIQVEQRLDRCTRCGKMLQASAEMIVGKGEGRNRELFCSERCQQEWLAMSESQTAGNGSEAS